MLDTLNRPQVPISKFSGYATYQALQAFSTGGIVVSHSPIFRPVTFSPSKNSRRHVYFANTV